MKKKFIYKRKRKQKEKEKAKKNLMIFNVDGDELSRRIGAEHGETERESKHKAQNITKKENNILQLITANKFEIILISK
jgi:hypothetical protein